MSILKRFKNFENLSNGLRYLYLHRAIRNIGWGFLNLFGVIFIYNLSGERVEFVLAFYGIVSVIYFLLLPLGAKLFRYTSLHRLMIISTFFCLLYLAGFYFLNENNRWIWAIVVALVFFDAFNKLVYWVPYHVDLARFVNKHHRGRQVSFIAVIVSVIGVVIPIFSSFIIEKYGFSVLFILAGLGVLISALPLVYIPHTREEYEFGYLESFRKVFNKKHIKINAGYFADGFQSALGLYVWPIFIYLLLKGNYYGVGFVSALIIFITVLLRFMVGELTDKWDKEKLLKMGNVLYAAGWVFKGLSVTGVHIFLAGVYHNFSNIFLRTPFDALTYEIAADEGHYVDEFSVLREMSLHLGKIFLALVAILVYTWLGVVWVFVAGAIVSLLMGLISKREFEAEMHPRQR